MTTFLILRAALTAPLWRFMYKRPGETNRIFYLDGDNTRMKTRRFPIVFCQVCLSVLALAFPFVVRAGMPL